MPMIDLERLRRTPLATAPFEHCIVPMFVRPEAVARIEADFPRIEHGGSFPLSALASGPAFKEFTDELLSPPVRGAFAETFEIDLSNRPATLTVRGRCRPCDGKIHTDSKSKLITVLIYLNRHWESRGGCLRLLRSPDDIDDVVAEVPPEAGMLVAFRCRDNAWHGHKPFDGVRRSIQLNWVTSGSAMHWSQWRHFLSSTFKRLRLAG
jgi:SM-20-related protein